MLLEIVKTSFYLPGEEPRRSGGKTSMGRIV